MWPDYFIIFLYTTIKLCPRPSMKIWQSRIGILAKAKSLKNCLKICQSGEIYSNLVTMAQKPQRWHKSVCDWELFRQFGFAWKFPHPSSKLFWRFFKKKNKKRVQQERWSWEIKMRKEKVFNRWHHSQVECFPNNG